MSVIIFAGPTISTAEVHEILPNALIRPPAAQGDIYLATREMPIAIGLIDGYFHQVPSVWHKEILWALYSGIRVYGASSMGALRATELRNHGMTGIGEIYEAYSSGVLEDDDEVAIIHAPQELGYAACSDAMVDIRWTLRAACLSNVIDPATAEKLQDYAKNLHYSRRSFDQMILDFGTVAELASFTAWIKHGKVNQKRIDATALCHAIKDDDMSKPETWRPVDFEETLHWNRLKSRLDRTLPR